jgi:ubiquinone/menaquinone biosynthesis C-methylase UbiE
MQNSHEYWKSHFASHADHAPREHAACLDLFRSTYLRETSTILDLACGSGRNARYLAQEGCEVYGVDFVQTAIMACTRLFQKQSLKGTFMQAAIDAIPLCSSFFDAVVCVAALDHVTVDCARRALGEMRRVLAREGMMLITFDHPHTDDDKLDQTEVLPDGTLQFIRGEYEGLLFRRYQDREIKTLVGEEHICSFDYGEEGSRIVVCR